MRKSGDDKNAVRVKRRDFLKQCGFAAAVFAAPSLCVVNENDIASAHTEIRDEKMHTGWCIPH